MRCAIVAVLLLLLASPVPAQIGLYNSEDGVPVLCNQIEVSGSLQEIYVVTTGEWTKARFSLPTNHCVVPILLEPMNGTSVTGDFASGFTLNFSGCTADLFAVARLYVVALSAPCCGFGPTPHPGAGRVELVDCTGHALTATWIPRIAVPSVNEWCINYAVSGVPRKPFPLDGAVNVPSSLELSWVMDPPVGTCDLGVRTCAVYLGTSTTPPIFSAELEGESQPVSGLQPGTTYYWKVWSNNHGFFVESPLWSFTTAAPVTVEPTTWGRVKALYRN